MKNTASKSITVSTLSIIILLFLSKVFGLVRELVIANAFGTSGATDAFFLAISVPNILFTAVGTSISLCVLPIYIEKRHSNSPLEADNYINNVITVFSCVAGIISAVGIIFAGALVGIMAPNFSGETYEMAVSLTKILMLSLVFMIAANIVSAVLNANKSYTAPHLIAIPGSLITILVTLLLAERYGIVVVAYATVAGAVFQLLIQIPFLNKIMKLKPRIDLKDEALKKTAMLVIPIVLAASMTQLNEIVDRIIASGLAEGSISAIAYSNKLIFFMSGIVITAISTSVFSVFADKAAEGDIAGMRVTLMRSIIYVVMFILPMSAIAFIYDYEIIQMIFLRGSFTEESVRLTSYAFLYYTCGMIFTGINSIYTRVFYSLKETVMPFVNSAVSIAVNIILSILLSKQMGVSGIALATSISAALLFLLNTWSLYKKIKGFDVKRIFNVGIKIAIATFAMSICILAVKWFMPFGGYMDKFAAGGIVGLIVYYFALKIAKLDEFKAFCRTIKKFFYSDGNNQNN